MGTKRDAVLEATGAERISSLMLCDVAPELHGHVVPRFAHEDPERRPQGPFEAYDFGASKVGDGAGVDRELCAALRTALGGMVYRR